MLKYCTDTSEQKKKYLDGSYECNRHSLLKLVDWCVEVQDLYDLKETDNKTFLPAIDILSLD